jgi:hypothetical protein
MPTEPCDATMESPTMPGHTHTCNGIHSLGDHKCSDPTCRRWFWKNVEVDR